MDFMNSIISSGANTDECSDDEPPTYIEENLEDIDELNQNYQIEVIFSIVLKF